MGSERLLLCGVSTRAAAESAARAGYAVTALDGFADQDQHEGVRALSVPRDFSRPFTAAGALAVARRIDSDSVAYLSPFENHPTAVDGLARGRALWGNPPDVLRRVRDPRLVERTLRRRGLPALSVRASDSNDRNDSNVPSWLLKPLRSGGGHRIRPWRIGRSVPRGYYLQERIDGTPGSVVFVAAAGRVVVLAVTRQLIGEASFGAEGFRYCGNILAAAGDAQFAHAGPLFEAASSLARAIAEDFDLVGVNAIDFVAANGVPYVVEVNPRWSGSMELVERAAGVPVFPAHARACVRGVLPASSAWASSGATTAVGKAIVFARAGAIAGDTRAWLGDSSVRDVPRPGEQMPAGQPVCTVFAAGRDAAECREALTARAARVYEEMERWPARPA